MFLTAVNSNLYGFVILGIIIILLVGLLRYFKQPYVIAYILAGVLLGDFGFEIITDKEVISVMGDFGLILLLFFIGMEISLPDLVKNWKIAIIGTFLQIVGSVALVSIIGWMIGWQTNQIIVMGFVISLSSSAVVIKLLHDNGELSTSSGKNVLSILLMQDILIVPMVIATNYLGGQKPSIEESILQIVGGILIIGAIIWVWRKKEFEIPFSDTVEEDHELQVFIALVVCFGCALITSIFGLSGALGAFVGGMVIRAARSAKWIHDSLHSLRVMFVALFFVSIGMLIDLNFLVEHWETVGLVIIAVYLTNHLVNTIVLQFFGRNWKENIYGGALLAQVGELGFVLVASAMASQIISDYIYQMTVIVISLTLLISPFWIALTKKVIGRK